MPFAIFLVLAKYFFFFTVDDAFINFRYSENLALHNQLNWNINSSERVEGYTNFLWVIIGFVLIKLDLSVVLWSKALGALFGLFSLFFLYLLSKKILKSKWLALIPMFLFALTPAFSFWSVAGLETALFIFLLIISVYLFLNDLEKNTSYSPWAFSLLALTRPEGAVIFTFSFFYLAFFNCKKLKTKKLIHRMLIWALPFILIYGTYFIWRFVYYGNLFPNTFYAKKMLLGGLSDILIFNKYAFIFILSALFLFALEKRSKLHYYLLCIIILLNLTVLNIKTIMGFNFRFLIPTAPFIYILASPSKETCNLFISKTKNHLNFWKKSLFALFVLLMLIYPLSGLFPFNNTKDTMMSGAQRWAEIEHSYEKIGRYLNNYQDKVSGQKIKIAIGDAGGIPYYSKLSTTDLLGLNDNVLSRNRLDYTYVLSIKPKIMMLINDNDKIFENNYDFALSYLLVNSREFQQDYELKSKYKTSGDTWLWIYYSRDFKEEFEIK